MSEANRTIVRRILEDLWNKKAPALIDEIYASNYVLHSADSTLHGPAGYRQIYTTNVTAFPDCHFTIEDIVTEGDKVVTRFTFRGTHQGDWRGIAPTGKQVTVQGIAILRTASGKVVEEWAVWDTLSRMQQLGVVPMSG